MAEKTRFKLKLPKDSLGASTKEGVYKERFLKKEDLVKNITSLGIDEGFKNVIANASTPSKRRLAEQLRPLVPSDDYLTAEVEPRLRDNVRGYVAPNSSTGQKPEFRMVDGRPYKGTEDTFLHESVHAATFPRLGGLEHGSTARDRSISNIDSSNIDEAVMSQYLSEHRDYRRNIKREKSKEAGSTNRRRWEWGSPAEQHAYLRSDEFFTRSITDKALQEKLKTMPLGRGQQDGIGTLEKLKELVGVEKVGDPKTKLGYTKEAAMRLLDSFKDMPADWKALKAIQAQINKQNKED